VKGEQEEGCISNPNRVEKTEKRSRVIQGQEIWKKNLGTTLGRGCFWFQSASGEILEKERFILFQPEAKTEGRGHEAETLNGLRTHPRQAEEVDGSGQRLATKGGCRRDSGARPQSRQK